MAPIRFNRYFPSTFVVWARCVAMFVGVGALYTGVVLTFLRAQGKFHPERRRALATIGAAAIAAPAALTAFAVLRREDLRFREIEVRYPGLPRDLDGLRLVQISDIHLSPLVSESVVERAVGMANDARAHVAFITGDLVTMKGDPLDTCLRHLSRVKAEAGVLGCMGNHEHYAQALEYTEQMGGRLGMRFLRSESAQLVFGSARINVVGVDYQRRGQKYLEGIDRLVQPGAFNLLLSHNPDVFPVAAAQGFDLTLAGHTHGGQVTVEIFDTSLNIARFLTPYVYGLYEKDRKSIYVTRGIGTIGVPARLGAPPEVVLVRLCAT
jgi:predicted MPP superfamily phosphohydrolase